MDWTLQAPILLLLTFSCGKDSDPPNPRSVTAPQTAASSADGPQNANVPKSPDAPLPSPSPGSDSDQASLERFESYWPLFRRAIETNDREKIADLTRFPFETRGDSDDDPVRKHDRANFTRQLDVMLSTDPGLLMTGKETQKQHIERTMQLTDRQFSPGDESARVGSFEFIKEHGRWWFSRAYVHEDE